MITLTTDFGDSAYVGAVRGAIKSIHPDADVLDITHSVPPHDIQAGAFALFSAVPYHPPGAVHVVVVDPGVGTDRRGIAIEAGGQLLVGPDNGVLMPAARRLGLEAIVELTQDKYFHEEIARTFHGRDIFAPVAAHLDLGVAIADLGRELHEDEVVDLDFGEPFIHDGVWTASAINVDRFGNVTTNLPGAQVLDASEFGATAIVEVNRLRFDVSLHRTYGDAPEGEPVMVVGSAGFAELSLREESFADAFGVEPGDELDVQFLPRELPEELTGEDQ